MSWLGGASSSMASLASGPKWYPFCFSLGSTTQKEEEEEQRQEQEEKSGQGLMMDASGS